MFSVNPVRICLHKIEIQKELTQTLCGGTLEQVVNGGTHNHPLAARVDTESTDFNTVTTSNVLDKRCLANNLDQLLASIALLEDVADVTRGHLLLQGDGDRVLFLS